MKFLFGSFLLLSSFFIMAQDWQTNLNKAKAEAKKEKKVIVLVFQGSDWCAPCIKMDRDIWSTNTFKKYASKNYVMLKADFPRKKKNALSPAQTKYNKSLAKRYNPKGHFPLVVVLDANGKVLGTTGYKKLSAQQYINHLNSFIKK